MKKLYEGLNGDIFYNISIGKIDLNLFRYPPQYINKVFFGKYLEFPNGVYSCPYNRHRYRLDI